MRNEIGQFQPGESGNPKGRPKGSGGISLLTIIKDVLSEVHPTEQKTIAALLIRKYILETLEKNDGQAVRDLVDRIDGKAMQNINVQNEKDAEWLDYFRSLDGTVESEADADNRLHDEETAEDNNT